MSFPNPVPRGAPRIVICDYNAMLQGVTGVLRMNGYQVFQAYDGEAARELCSCLQDIRLLVLNTEGSGSDAPALVHAIREQRPGLPVLHVGMNPLPDMPDDVAHLHEGFGARHLLEVVEDLVRK